jgi:hypothetical protein
MSPPATGGSTVDRPLLLHHVELDGRVVDVIVRAGHVEAIGPDLSVPPGARVVEGDGRAVLPGLHDHHLHLLALAASLDSVDLAAATSSTIARWRPRSSSATRRREWLRAVGHRRPQTDRSTGGSSMRWPTGRYGCSTGRELWCSTPGPRRGRPVTDRSPRAARPP